MFRVKSSGTEIGSARKVDDNRLFLLFNRNNVPRTLNLKHHLSRSCPTLFPPMSHPFRPSTIAPQWSEMSVQIKHETDARSPLVPPMSWCRLPVFRRERWINGKPSGRRLRISKQ
eukprot:589774-Amorphochlora_amoeboformis.AAC.1